MAEKLEAKPLTVVKVLSIRRLPAPSQARVGVILRRSPDSFAKRADMLTTSEIPGSPSIHSSAQKLTHRFSTPATDRILVVQDDRAVQKALKRMFEAEGYSVQIAPDGNAAVEIFRAGAPSAVVLDLRLPGLSGREVCR